MFNPTLFNPENASPKLLILAFRTIFIKEVQPEKADPPILVTELPIVTLVKLEQP